VKRLGIVLLLVGSFSGYAQQPPGSDAFLLDMSIGKKGVTVTNPLNVSNQAGYDNQPFFHPVQPVLYYSSAKEESRTDIMAFDFSSRQSKNLTQSREREYSPTVTPDGTFISCILQRDNGAQDLVKYPVQGGVPSVIINSLIVGYHAWITQDVIALFVLGDTLSLHVYNTTTGQDKIVAKNIGRSLHRIPGKNEISFIEKTTATEWFIKRLDKNGSVKVITKTLPGKEDMAWSADGKIFMSDGNRVLYLDTKKKSDWKEISLPPDFPKRTITRIAINANATKIALVVAE